MRSTTIAARRRPLAVQEASKMRFFERGLAGEIRVIADTRALVWRVLS